MLQRTIKALGVVAFFVSSQVIASSEIEADELMLMSMEMVQPKFELDLSVDLAASFEICQEVVLTPITQGKIDVSKGELPTVNLDLSINQVPCEKGAKKLQ